MAAIMRILGWKSLNLRCPDHTIDLCNQLGKPYQITLVQMPNGTGKTTTLNLLRAALSGVATNWNKHQVKEYQKRGNTAQNGSFELQLLLNQRRATIIMDFNFNMGVVSYKTTYGEGQRMNFDPPSDFKRFMNSNFINFFVFDGELAQNLLNNDSNNAERVVEHLFQIDTLNTIAYHVKSHWNLHVINNSATEEKGYQRRKNRVDNLRRRIRLIEQEKTDLESQYHLKQQDLAQKQSIYQQEIQRESDRATEIMSAQLKYQELNRTVDSLSIKGLDIMADPYALSHHFAVAIHNLKEGLDRVKLPESAAREFFEELAQEAECVCGRPIDTSIREIIRYRATRYLGSEDVSLLNSMKSAIDDALQGSLTDHEEELKNQLSLLSNEVYNQRLAQNELDLLEQEAQQSDPAIKKASEDITQLKYELEQIKQNLRPYSSDDERLGDESPGLEVIKRRLKKAEDDLADITKTRELKEKSNILEKVLNTAYHIAKAGVTAEICAEANMRIREILPDNTISIDRIDRSLVLRGQAGGSVGEQLSIAYAFLATLFHRAEHELPFVVDSPAGPIDLAVRPKIGALVPKLTNQFIAFTISSERDGFVSHLKRTSQEAIQYITLFRKKSSGLLQQAQATGHAVETDDGCLVISEEFFNTFQVDAEDTQ